MLTCAFRLILATDLSPISVLSRLTRYVIGSGTVTVYSPHLQVLAEVLQWTKRDPSYLGGTLTESWTRTYQVSLSWCETSFILIRVGVAWTDTSYHGYERNRRLSIPCYESVSDSETGA